MRVFRVDDLERGIGHADVRAKPINQQNDVQHDPECLWVDHEAWVPKGASELAAAQTLTGGRDVVQRTL